MSRNKKGKGAAADFGYAMPTTVGILNHDPTRPRAPGFSFGTRPSEKDRPRAPGPQYKVDQGLTPRGTGYNPSFSITKRPRRTVWDSMMTQGPSPGAYSPHDTSSSGGGGPSAPMYSFGKPFKSRKRTPVPAPNTYNIPGTIGSQAPELSGNGPASSLRGKISGSKGFAHDFARTPGPAKYDPVELSHTKKRSPAPTMKGRFKIPSWETVTPGPAAYQATSLEKYSKDSPRVTTLRTHYKGSMRPPLFTMTDVSI